MLTIRPERSGALRILTEDEKGGLEAALPCEPNRLCQLPLTRTVRMILRVDGSTIRT